MQIKICTECKQEKPLDQYDQKRGKLRSNCKACVSKYTKQHYKNNKEYYLKKATINRKSARERLRKFLFEYYSTHSCVDCGESNPIVLEFDHIQRQNKYSNIARMANRALSLERIKNEIAKCEVVCANCHKKRTAKQFNWYKNLRWPNS
ncbi:hypothetical protein HY385_01925 [Candidatus Daviesbacteria bacterium]|nr:hypothetical protein [Candidatus Daviesbacteria bacterium]